MKAVYFVCVAYSTTTACISFKKKGLSKQFRHLLFRRHVSFCILTLFCQSTSLITWIHLVDGVEIPKWLEAFCVYYFPSVGFILGVLRLSEPLVLSTSKREFA